MEHFLAGLISFFGFNLNPMSKVQNEINHFKATYQQNIRTYQGIHREIGYSFAGSPQSRPVVFVHGSPGSKDSWYAYFLDQDLTARFHLLAIDRPGYGDSGSVSEKSLTKQAEDIWEVLKLNQSGKPPIFVGHSYGGPVIAKIGILHPLAVSALIFVASSVDPMLEETKFIQWVGELWGVRSLIPNHLRVCNEEILALKKELIRMEPEWSTIRARVAIIHGDQDDLVPVANVDFIAAKTRLDHREILRGVNHFIPWDRPSIIKAAILKMDSL